MSIAAMHRPSVLICDDSLEEIRFIVSVLKTADYKLIVARNGKDACDRASVLNPDLILLDVRMPVMDGFAACRLLKAHSDTRHIPVIFLTAANDIQDRLEGLRAGAVDYIVKPANEEEVLLRVEAQLARNNGPLDSSPEAFSANEENAEHTGHHALVHAFIRLLEQCSDAELHPEALVNRIGTNRQSLTEAFRSVVGTSVYGWLREQRMKRASLWLSRSTLSVNQIARDLGYSTSGNFATAFKERYGITPREFRKRALADPNQHLIFQQQGATDLSPKANPWLMLERGATNLG